ncbi:MAG TPA: hypothetical protein PL182_06955 [Pseudobdellovibrionaceae bacterium]|nr:hypothetical protein [Pseudobdellovibrionaceae bacterium]
MLNQQGLGGLMKTGLFAIVFLLGGIAAARPALPKENPRRQEKMSCHSIYRQKMESLDVLPTTYVTNTVGALTTWVKDDLEWERIEAAVYAQDDEGNRTADHSIDQLRQRQIEKRDDGLQIERTVVWTKYDTANRGSWETEEFFAVHSRFEDGRKIILKSFRNGIDVPDRTLVRFEHRLGPQRRLVVNVEKTPYLEHRPDGMIYEISRSETSCLFELL